DQVVRDLRLAQRRRHRARRRGDAQAPAALRQRNAVRQTAARPHAVEHPRHLAGVAPALGRLLLEGVDLLEDEDRYDDFVVRELEDRAGIVDEDVRVENEVFHAYFDFFALPCAIVTFFMTTSVSGLSRGPRFTPVIL